MYLYVLGCNDAIKFGIAKDVQARQLIFKTGNPYPLTVITSIKIDRASQLEKKIHFIFSKTKISGEWFKYNDQIQTLINVIKEGDTNKLTNLVCSAYKAHKELKNNPKYEGIYFDVETVIYGDGGFHLSCWDKYDTLSGAKHG
ncbi:MAG: hypothetical protein DDT19_02656 [Syntrophomonadaceae bacterium]|nr:hypothetical protein [Bacillota bacterium]